MRRFVFRRLLFTSFVLALWSLSVLEAHTQTNTPLRVMAANLNGNVQSYQPFAIRIFQGLKPDIVAIQEFNYNNNTPADFQEFVQTAFGSNFVYFREDYVGIPNGIISRYPIVASGSWPDVEQSSPNRGFAWAQIALPGTNSLYVVSVHLLTSSSGTRANEAANLKALIQSNFPANAWVVVAGDLNTDSRSEAALTTFQTFLSDNPIPTDAEASGDADTNLPRNKPYDYVLPSFAFRSLLMPSAFASHSFSNGLVFDSRVYSPLSDVAPVLSTDSTNGQHMAVVKDFSIPGTATNLAPSITAQPQSQTVNQGTTAPFTVTANGTAPLSYQWRFQGTNIIGATNTAYSRTNVQPADAGNYSVVVSNVVGSAISSNALLTVNSAPGIINPPQSQAVAIGQDAPFTVIASGAMPLTYQWRFNATNIPGATASNYTRTNVQNADAGKYAVLVSNSFGAITSADATLTVVPLEQTVIAQWNFNSLTPDTNVVTGVITPWVGSGTASLVGGTSQTFATGSGTDPAASGSDNSGWNSAGYPAQGSGNKTAGVQFTVSTVGRQNISVRWDLRASNTGSKYSRLQYTTNGSSFVDFPAATVLGTANTFESKTNSLAGVAAVNNNPNFAIRMVAEFESTAANTTNATYVGAGGSYGSSGTLRYDMVTISGTAIGSTNGIVPASLSAPVYSNGQFQFNLTGQQASNYVIQATTNLQGANWLSVRTNAAPFIFIETNVGLYQQRFYRALSLP